MGVHGCAVVHCLPLKIHGRHRFVNPMYSELFQMWVAATGNPELGDKDPDYIYRRYRICSKHFQPEDMECRGTRYYVKHNVVPTLNLPDRTNMQVYTIAEEHTYTRTSNVTISDDIGQLQSEIEEHSCDTVFSATIPDAQTRDVRTPSPSTSTMHSRKGTRSRLLLSISTPIVAQLTPKKKILYDNVKFYHRQTRLIAKRRLNLSGKLGAAANFSVGGDFEKLTRNMSVVAQNFFRYQVECSNKKLKSRRFSLQDKITALALFKQCGSRYKLLSRMFALPSTVTIMKLLNRIQIDAISISGPVFEGMKKVADTIPP